MAAEPTSTATGQTTASVVPATPAEVTAHAPTLAAPGAAQTDTAGATDAQTPAATLPEAERNRIAAEARRDGDAKAKEAARELAKATARLAELEAAEQARKDAELSEIEKAQRAAKEAEARADAAEAARQQAIVEATRSRLIATTAPDLPAPFQAQVSGATDEEIAASIAQAQAAWQQTQAQVAQRILTMTPEQAVVVFGDDIGKVLGERLQGRSASLGVAANPGGAVPAPAGEWNSADPNSWTAETWALERKRLGIG